MLKLHSSGNMTKAAEFRSFVTGRLSAATRDILAAFERLLEEWEPQVEETHSALRGAKSSCCLLEEEQKEERLENLQLAPPLTTQSSKKWIHLRIRILDQPGTNVVSKIVLQRCPVLVLRCPSGLSEENFYDLLTRTFPQLRAKHLELLTSGPGPGPGPGWTLKPLRVGRRTPELIQASVKKSVLFIRMKEPEEHRNISNTQSSSLKEEAEPQGSVGVKEIEACAGAQPPPCESEAATLELGEGDEMWTSVGNEEELKEDAVSKREQQQTKKKKQEAGSACRVGGASSEPAEHPKEHFLVQHEAERSHKALYECAVCGETFALKESFEDHQKVHAELHRCYICHRAFPRKDQLKSHRKTHSQQKTQQCGVCGKVLVDYRSLSRHMMVHSGERPHGCPQCGKSFKLLGALRQHQKIHTERQRSFLCHVCCKMFLTSQELNNHMSTHSEEKPHLCAQCGRGFSKKTALTLHLRTHSGDAPHRCSHCGRGFKRRSNLTQHLSVHTGEKPYVCLTCGKACARKVYLSAHVRTHSGERPYTCSVCHHGFSQSHSLKTHMRSHQGAPSSPNGKNQ